MMYWKYQQKKQRQIMKSFVSPQGFLAYIEREGIAELDRREQIKIGYFLFATFQDAYDFSKRLVIQRTNPRPMEITIEAS